jgi:O-glycosyl hydrolase
MGGSVIRSGLEDEWVEMMATLFWYAHESEKLQFDMIDPINEPDWDGVEGPQVDASQYTRVLEKLSSKLDAMGLSALRFIGPNTAQISTGVNTYMPRMMSSRIVMSKVDHFAFHNYTGDSGGADLAIKRSAHAGRNFWITEVTNAWDIMSHLGQNPSATLVWDAYDSVYHHAILAGRGSAPPNDVGNGPPLLQYNSAAGTYTRRPGFYQVAHIFRFVPKRSVRIGASESNAALQIYAFRDRTGGRVTIVGRNSGASPIPINGSLSNVPAVSAFEFYQTSGGFYFQRRSTIVVTGGAFRVTAPANSFFTLTSP